MQEFRMSEKRRPDEREVLQVILDALDQVDTEGRERILRTVSTFFDLDVPDQPRPIATRTPAVSSIPADERQPTFADRATLSPKEFLQGKQPHTDIERVACLAYYLSHYRDTPHFKTIDISKLNTEAAQLKFSNPAYTVVNATNSGLLTPAGKGKKQISAIGEGFVEALPDREDAKAVLGRMRRRRSRKKSPRPKKDRKVSK
jgi:hypothetical protein